jgi:hypothetical protein
MKSVRHRNGKEIRVLLVEQNFDRVDYLTDAVGNEVRLQNALSDLGDAWVDFGEARVARERADREWESILAQPVPKVSQQ